MKPAELHKRVAEVLGVSASQKELAFDVLIEFVADILSEGITLKIPRVGFFQLKNDLQKKTSKKQLIYSSLPEDFDPSEKKLYHSFEVSTKYKNASEAEPQVFSIGVGKPLLPLHDENSNNDSETSFAMLRKSIEERVREILAESDQIPNFSIWEDVLSNNEDETNTEEDISRKLFDLTKDLHFEEEMKPGEPEIEPQHQKFLNSLLLSEKPTASQEFFEEEKILDYSSIQETMDNQFIFDEITEIEKTLSANELTIDDLLGEYVSLNQEKEKDAQSLADEIDFRNTTEENHFVETNEQIEITVPKSFSAPEVFVEENVEPENSVSLISDAVDVNEDKNIFKKYAVDLEKSETDNFSSSNNGEVLKELLYDDEPEQSIATYSEITIEPPSSAKELLITIKDENSDDITNPWAISEEDLNGIITDELKEFDHEKIANDNSRVLNDLLEDAFHRKVDMDSTDEFEEESPVLENPDEFTVTEKIEWSWGDELKEEFGIGLADETDISPKNPLAIIEEVEEPEKEVESIKFDLEKTRQDLFSRLQQTLEKEVTALHENYSIPNVSEQASEPESEMLSRYEDADDELLEELQKPATQVSETKQVVEFKDEKVILDFKTPPPRYEFIEETLLPNIQQDFPEEPVLSKPKKMTILLERNELINNDHTSKEALQGIEEKPKKQKNLFSKLFIVTLSAFIVVTSIAVYLYINSLSKESGADKEVVQANEYSVQKDEDPNTAIQKSREALGLNPDDFSEFPITATPPEPVKEGNTVDVSKLLQKQPETNIPKNQEVVKPAQQAEVKNKGQSSPPNISSEETRLSEMVFFDGKAYNFQISSWKNKSLAQSEVDRLRSLGFNAFLVEAFLPNKGGTWYRIRIGTFTSEKEALEFKKKNSF